MFICQYLRLVLMFFCLCFVCGGSSFKLQIYLAFLTMLKRKLKKENFLF